jgi:general L-amino acid transport system permease protein
MAQPAKKELTRPVAAAELPPVTELGAVGWLKHNLFSTWYNAVLTLVALWLVWKLGGGLVIWAVRKAQWEVIDSNLRVFMVGAYPVAELWRVWTVILLVSLFTGISWGAWASFGRGGAVGLGAALLALQVLPLQTNSRLWIAAAFVAILAGIPVGRMLGRFKYWLIGAWVLLFAVSIVLIGGTKAGPWLPQVKTSLWNGLLLTLLLSISGIVFSFPLGVLLALGRQSTLPAIRFVSIAYIELIRAVPLISILFMAQLMVPLFMPPHIRPDNVLRAFIGITMFSAAYMAENVRGGLQAVPRGQLEAARALGLRGWQIILFIQLPQALRAVIPAIVGQFISLFKDTSLVMIVSLTDLVMIGKSVLSQPLYLGRHFEVYSFMALVYFIFSYFLSIASRRLERRLGVGER